MENIKSFKADALVIIYPNGQVKEMPIENKILHIEYLLDLYRKNLRFRRLIKSNNIEMPKTIYDTLDFSTYTLDKELARVGVMIIHNLFIDVILRNRSFIEKDEPRFYISLPNELTDDQRNILNEMYNAFDMECSVFGRYMNDSLGDIKYDDFLDILKSKTK